MSSKKGLELVEVQKAVGKVLCHDITKIIPGQFKGRAFKKGHIIQEEDIPELLKLGKDHIYVWNTEEGLIHENEAAIRIAKAVAKGGVTLTEPKEGKVNLLAEYRGLLKINVKALEEVNGVDQVMLATLHSNRVVDKEMVVAGTRVIPLVVAEEVVQKVETICQELKGVIEVKPLHRWKVGIVTTGNEVFYGRIQDAFGPVVKKKLQSFDCQVIAQVIVPDQVDKIVEAIQTLRSQGAELIITTGGMSVDPDDVTPAAVRKAGAVIVSYGAPVLPGAMFMMAYLDGIPVLGLPGCVMYAKTTVFDLVLPRILAGERITRQDLQKLGHGGLCLECRVCRYPDCSFGKGV